MSDLRYAARTLAKSPGFSLVIAALLAVGIGANTALFSAVDALLLRPLAVREPGRLIRIAQTVPRIGVTSSFLHEVYDGLQHAHTLSAVFGEAEWPIAMDEPKPAEQVRVHVVTPEFFDVLGVSALYGRSLTVNDAREEPGPPPAVLSYGFWQRRFGGDRNAVGRNVSLRGHRFTVVGVMPESFNGIYADNSPDIRIPVRAFPLLRFGDSSPSNGIIALELAARMKPGVTLAQARAECFAVWRAVMESYMRRTRATQEDLDVELSRGLQVESLEHGVSLLRDRFGLAARLLAASAGLLLLLMCSNIAGLLLARNAARSEEIAVRLALGATRARLLRQMLAESGLLALAGAAGGWLVARGSLPLLLRALPAMRDRATTPLSLSLSIAPDFRVLLFAVAVTVAVTLLFGLAPAMSSSRMDLQTVLRGIRSTHGGRHRDALVIFQIALCTLLLSGAGLLVRSFQQLRSLNPGFDAAHIVTFTAFPSLSGYTTAQCDKLRLALVARVRALPGVVAAATAARPLMRGSGFKTTVRPQGEPITRADFLNTSSNSVSPEYFDAMGMPILEGRGFLESDRGVKPVRIVVNKSFAREFFPGADPIGRRVWNGVGDVSEIIGVVSDAKYRSLREPFTPTIYNSLDSADVFVLCVRTRIPPETMIQPVRRELAALDPALPFTEIHTLEQEVDASAAAERLTASLATVFGSLAALLAALGIYSLLSYAVAQRRREIGVRMAIGARPADIGRMVGRRSLLLVVIGVSAGLLSAWRLAPAIQLLLYDVSPSDPRSLIAATVFVLAISAAATTIPALRATRIQPAAALRDDAVR